MIKASEAVETLLFDLAWPIFIQQREASTHTHTLSLSASSATKFLALVT
jgi:hypothetical protein